MLANSSRSTRRGLAMGIDAGLIVISAWLAYSLRTGMWQFSSRPIIILVALALVSWFGIAGLLGVYRAIIRSSGGQAVMNLVIACLLLALPMSALLLFIGIAGIPRTLGLLQPLVFLLLLLGSRLVIRFVLVDLIANETSFRQRIRVLIYGAGRAGQQLATSLRMESNIEVAGYLDDDPMLVGALINGKQIYAANAVERLVDDYDIDEVLLALPSISRARRREIFDFLTTATIKVRALPSIGNIMEGRVSVSDLREVRIEELLGRDPVAPDQQLLASELVDRVVMVTGAGGSIGSELCRQIVQLRPRRLILVEQSEYALYRIAEELRLAILAHGLDVDLVEQLLDVSHQAAVDRVFDRSGAQIVFHAAAYKHVPLVESNPIAGLWNNIFGTLFCSLAAARSSAARFILVSTDKAVRPTNVMGASKRICELVLQALAMRGDDTFFSMVRFGNVLGSSGSVVPKFQEQIAAGGPVTVTDNRVTRYFMTIPEASQLVIQAGSMARGGEVFVLDMGQPVLIRDLAETMIHLSGLTVRSDENPGGDIAIEEVGLRPGEKLFEELLIGYNPIDTAHESIMLAREDFLPWPELESRLTSLRTALDEGDAPAALAIMAELVPEYAPAKGQS